MLRGKKLPLDEVVLEGFIAEHRLPLRVWAAPELERCPALDVEALSQRAGPGLEWVSIAAAEPAALVGPAVMLLAPGDVRGAEPELVELARQALPGRPVVLGGTDDKDILLAAINTWRAFRVLPADSGTEVLLDGLRQTLDAAQTEWALSLALEQYQQEQQRLLLVVEGLKRAKDEVLQSERFAMVGRATRALLDALNDNFSRLASVGRDLQQTLSAGGKYESLYRSAMDGLAATCALLQDMAALGAERGAEEGPWTLDLAEQALRPLIERVVAFCRFDPLARTRSLALEIENGALRARIDRRRLFPALLNLLRNAMQATPPGGSVTCRLRREGDEAVIEVEDTGCGMPTSVREQLFVPFFTTKEGAEGLGLGMHMTKLAVDLHGGQIQCSSEPERGTRVRIALPAR